MNAAFAHLAQSVLFSHHSTSDVQLIPQQIIPPSRIIAFCRHHDLVINNARPHIANRITSSLTTLTKPMV